MDSAHLRLSGHTNVELHAVRFGPARSERALVVLHGVWESWRTFEAFAPALGGALGDAVYLIDLRGHGDSDRPERGYRFADYTADVLAALDQLTDRHEQVDILGHSLGAVVALFTAAAGHPALRRSVLVDPPILRPEDWPGIHAMADHARDLAAQPIEVIQASLDTGRRAPEWVAMLAQAQAQTAPGVFAALCADGEQTVVDWAELPPVSTPIRVLAPDQDVPGALLVGPRLALFRSLLPTADIVVVPGAGHHIEADCPADFERLVNEFLTGPV
jgi:pimeloyl-ACP methyl ester carboxylesterase